MSEETSLLQSQENQEILARRKNIQYVRRLLYLSHAFAMGSQTAWEFCLILFLSAVTQYKSIFLVSTYGVVSNSIVTLFGGSFGIFIDKNERLFVAQFLIFSQNICVIISTCFCLLLLGRIRNDIGMEDDATLESNKHINNVLAGFPVDDNISILLVVAIHIFGPVADLLSKGFLVAIEKDWVVVMSKMVVSSKMDDKNESSASLTSIKSSGEITTPEERAWLAETNVFMKQIDLSCRFLAPTITGFAIAAFGDDLQIAAFLIGILNIGGLLVEYKCTAEIYKLVPLLSIRHAQSNPSSLNKSENIDGKSNAIQDVDSEIKSIQGCEMNHAKTALSSASVMSKNAIRKKVCIPSGLETYLKQPTVYGGIALAILYINVLSFGALMTAYLVWRKMSLVQIGLWRGISALIGLLGTSVYHCSVTKYSTEATGQWAITLQFTCLTVCYLSLYVTNNALSLALLIGGVCTSRVGLYVFDISIVQIMQELVPDGARGVVGGIQESMNSFFFLISFVVALFFPDPKDFSILVATGYIGVGLSMILHTFGVFLNKNLRL
mmetsp:Transcript_37385/g.43522  ORF Transcript_37385/g.43522 Transcript_37385/m.43522 type:complete len:552 (+) Transcript_37385:184-1839(+)